jgi:hypothetical protein
VVVRLASVLVGAVAVRYLLRAVVGCEVSLGAAIAALVTGSAVSLGLQLVLGSAARNGGGLAMPATGMIWFATGLIGAVCSYLVLQHAVVSQPRAHSLDPYLNATGERLQPPATLDDASYDECVSAVRETSAALVEAATRAHLDNLSDVVLNGLPYLDAATDALQRAEPLAKVPAPLSNGLLEAVRTAREDLLGAAREAALGADPRLRLADSEGMRKMRQAFRELAELDVAVDW